MKKSIIALAVAGALTAPMIAQADATLYGVAQFRATDRDQSTLDFKMAKTRLGVKGTVDNDIEGLTTGFQFEWEFNGNGTITGSTASDNTTVRKSLVYMKGGFGQLTFGRQNNPVNQGEAMTDILGQESAWGHVTPDRIGKAVTYVSPSFGGFSAYAGAGADGAAETAGNTNENLDVTAVGASWAGMGINLTGGVVNKKNTVVGGNDKVKQTVLGASYSGVENLYVAVSHSEEDAYSGATKNEEKTLAVAASYTIDKVTLAAIHTTNEPSQNAAKQKQTQVGVRYALGAKASVGVDYADYNSEAETAGNGDALVLEYTLAF